MKHSWINTRLEELNYVVDYELLSKDKITNYPLGVNKLQTLWEFI